jgi:hypothetical protein
MKLYSAKDQTETLIAENHQRIRESYLALRHLCASVARADEAIAKSVRIIEQCRVSVPAMMDRADEATPARTKMAARIVQGLREAGFGCELLNPPPLH